MSIKLGNIEDIVMKRVISAGDSVICVNVDGASRSKLVVGYVYKVESVVNNGHPENQVSRIKLFGINDWSFRIERFELLDDLVKGSEVFAVGKYLPEPLKALNRYKVEEVFTLAHLDGEERKVRLVGFGNQSFNITHFSLASKHIKFSDHQIHHHTAGTTVDKTTVPNSGESTFRKKGPSVVDFVKVDGISEFIVLHQLYYNKDKDMWDSNLMGEELDGQLDWIRGAWHMFKEQYNG